MKKGWKTEPLGELCDIRNGSTPSKGNPTFWDGGTIPWFTIDDMREQGREISSTRQKITKSALSETSVKLLPEDSVLLCCTASVGEFAITRIPLTTNQQFNGLVVKNRNQLDPNFLFHYVSTLKDELLGLSGKTTIDFIPISRLRDVAVPVPPLAEQQRIVGLLDEAFEGLATAKANAEKNLQNARALFESHLQTVFTQRGPGWVETTLGEAYDVRDGTHDSPKYHGTGYPLITSKNLKREGLSFDDVRLISEQDYTKINERSAVHKGDVLFAMIGTIGNPTLVEVEPNFAIKNVALFKNPNGQSGAFLKHYLDSGMVISKMMKEAKGTTQKFVGLGYLRGFPINLPPLATQLKIAEELDAMTEETQRLARLYERKHAALEALKKSLLHQAFTGEL